MNIQTHCYNDKCINGIALKNCEHVDCENKTFFPSILPRDENNNLLTEDGSFYCERACKAKVIMVDYNPEAKPRTLKEMQFRINLMKQRYLEGRKDATARG